MTATWAESASTKFVNENSTSYPNWPNDWAMLWVLICTVHFGCMSLSCHVRVSDLIHIAYLPECQNRRKIWSFSDCNWNQTQLPFSSWTKAQPFNGTGKKMIELFCDYLSVRCILAVCSSRVTYAFQSESTLYSCLNVSETPCLKKASTLKFKWLQLHLNPAST